ncbi:hypothetical protein [Legionella pneumophila]|uniref:hypothetical protein n=1 Tax=Legionella pneumophila TaxID=446 RepID=UPI0007786F41|nr:hypothetical protein [Legionella pneumophila]HAT8606380.1 hypothetical protein [Legionella pneumophila]
MRYSVFIHTNSKQKLGSLVAAHAIRRYSKFNKFFDVSILNTDSYSLLSQYEGERYLRRGVKKIWTNKDLQSFTPLRFLPPELMNYAGRALVIDPDVFACVDIWPLLSSNMNGKAILCRERKNSMKSGIRYASSVMLLDCSLLKHWKMEAQFEALFNGTRDYHHWINLLYENPDSIGLINKHWNDMDSFSPATKMLHNTERLTQPWKTGLTIDWQSGNLMKQKLRTFYHSYLIRQEARYKQHPDHSQERFFYSLLKECVDSGMVSKEMLEKEMKSNHIRHDSLNLILQAPILDAESHPYCQMRQ